MRGTTILPAVIVVLVLAVLGLLWVRNWTRSSTTITRKDRSDIRAIDAACELYALDHDGAWPPDLAALLVREPGRPRYLHGARIPLDPWRRAYFYFPPELPEGRPRIGTLGRDGVPGGEDADADLDNCTDRAELEAWADAEAR